jgi:hypothetical protein
MTLDRSRFRPGTKIQILTGGESTMNAGPAPATVVLVHGGFADGSGWQAV